MKQEQASLPAFVSEQLSVDEAKFKAMGDYIPSDQKETIFISHAWQLQSDKDIYGEQYVDEFVKRMAWHASLLGFTVILDFNNLGIGVHLDSSMKKSVEECDHVLLVLTKTYFYKVKQRPQSGVARELSYIEKKIDDMGGASVAGESRFVLPFLLTDKIPGFPIVEGHGGFAAIYLDGMGYENALIDLHNKLYKKTAGNVFSAVGGPQKFKQALEEAKAKISAEVRDVVAGDDVVAKAVGGDAIIDNVKSSSGDLIAHALSGRAVISNSKASGGATAIAVPQDVSDRDLDVLARLDRFNKRK